MSSPDGVNWSKAAEFKLMDKVIPMADGTGFKPEKVERPFVYEENGEIQIIGFALKDGKESFIVTLPVRGED